MNRLHYFCTVAQTGSLTKASELLHISQPALSKALKTLEGELDLQLLQPSGRGIAVTDAGKRVAEYSRPLLEKLHNLRTFNAAEAAQKPLRLATFEVFSTYFAGHMIANEFASDPVEIIETVPGPMEEAIVSGQADIGITYLPIPHPDLDILKVTSIRMGIFATKNFVADKDLRELPFVVPNIPVAGTPSKVAGLDGWPDHLLPRKTQFRMAMLETALDLCRRGLCVGYFPSFVIELHNAQVKSRFHLHEIPAPAKLKTARQDVYLMKRKSDVESTAFKKIAKALRLLAH